MIDLIAAPPDNGISRVSLPKPSPSQSNGQPLNSAKSARATILVIDDDRTIGMLVERRLAACEIQTIRAATAAEGRELIKQAEPDVVLLDVRLPDESGLEAFAGIQALDRQLPVIFITASGASDTAIQAMRLGAFDYLPKPLDLNRLQELVEQAVESRNLMKRPVAIDHEQGLIATPNEKSDALVGQCPLMQEVFKAVGRVAPQNVTVLIRGESGTGKELIARAIFQYSSRNKGPFLAVNCAALTDTLLESELFGHEKGAFTGAHGRRIGKFEQCSGGTIFLDEVGDMSPILQAKVLRLLQEQRFERVGGNETIETDVRIVSATNRALEQMVAEGQFREDLFYRLNGYTIHLPPLRERQDDIKMLLEHFLAMLNRELGRDVQVIAPEALQRLLGYSWPGNVRELQGVLRQALLHVSGSVLMPSALPPQLMTEASVAVGDHAEPAAASAITSTSASASTELGKELGDLASFIESQLATGSTALYEETLHRMERTLLPIILRHTQGNQSEAARILGITRGNLRSKIRQHSIAIEQVISLHPDSDS
jgi:two-component system nitrogen regulation response regulator GlnG